MRTKWNPFKGGTAPYPLVKKVRAPLLLLSVVLIFPFITGSDYIWREDIVKGSDRSSYRCPNGLVKKGDLARHVLDKCGEPMRRARMQLEPYDIWIYRLGTGEYIVYMAFTHQKVQRIFHARCWEENPHCN